MRKIHRTFKVFSKAPFKKKSDAAPKRQDLFDM